MVYCGKPSKGCAPCRIKRTKCDLGLPSCGQCIRTGRYCSGYRLEAYEEFRDQSREVVVRQSSLQKKRHDITPSPTCQSITGIQSFNTCWESRLPPDLTFPYRDDFAISFFWKDYVLPEVSVSSTIFNELPRLYSEAAERSALSMILMALGLACLSNTLKRRAIMMKANAKYAEALKLINSALRDPVEAKNDLTLLVVLLLGLYEEINSTASSLEPWNHHVKGSLALLEYRGEQQLHSQIGQQLISAIRYQVVVNSLMQRVDVPTTLLKWSKLAREYSTSEKDKAEGELADIMAKLCNVLAVIESCNAYIDPVNLVRKTVSIDAELENWATKWQSNKSFTTVFIKEASPDVFGDYWHLYSDVLLATLWNTYRAIRIRVNQTIIEQLHLIERSFPAESIHEYSSIYEHQVEKSKNRIVESSHAICATIPFYMHHSYYSDQEGWDSAYGPKNTARTKTVIWQLYAAGQNDYVSDVLKFWVSEQLIKMGLGMGLGKAVALGRLLQMKQKHIPKRWREIGRDD